LRCCFIGGLVRQLDILRKPDHRCRFMINEVIGDKMHTRSGLSGAGRHVRDTSMRCSTEHGPCSIGSVAPVQEQGGGSARAASLPDD